MFTKRDPHWQSPGGVGDLITMSSRSRSLSPRRRGRPTSPSSPPSPTRQRRLHPPPAPTMGSLVKSWLLTPQFGAGASGNVETFSPRVLPKTPVLTLLLIRLDETLPQFMDTLAVPTMEQAAQAASLLDHAVATASSSPTHSSPSSPSSVSSSALALHSCWETYMTPFLLLSAAEALYVQERSPRLVALYERIDTDLQTVQQTLCDPFLRDDQSHYYEKAVSVQNLLNVLQSIVAVRMQLLAWIIAWPQQRLDSVAIPTVENNALVDSVQTEVQLGQWLDQACLGLANCRFRETILAVRRIQVRLDSLKYTTSLHEWFRTALQEVRSLLPLYFDRIRAQAKPLYGFDPARIGSVQQQITMDYDALIWEHLKKHEGAMAICVVFRDEINDEWPAMYLRSNVGASSKSTNSSLSPRLLMKREPAVKSDEVSYQEYTADGSWPLTEWSELVAIVRNEVNPEELGPALTFRAKEEEQSATPNRTGDSTASYFHVVALSSCAWLVAIVKDQAYASDGSRWNLRISRGTQSSEENIRAFLDELALKLRVHNLVANVNESLAAMREQDVARISNKIETTKNQHDKRSKKGPDLSIEDLCSEWNEANTNEWLRSVKDHFGLRPQSPGVEALHSPYFVSKGRTQSLGRMRTFRRRRDKTAEDSAAALFLGSDLMRMAKEGRLSLE